MEDLLGPIICALITGGMALIGVIITNSASNNKMQAESKAAQAVVNNKIENLTHEVRKHNDFAERVPILEEKVRNLEQDVEDLKK